ncbi:MAG TPA: hemolysin III family protein [Dermatophilaceae bacterium]|nr:hemolysin III family protein [Dermatophilaceae bacterium]
MDRPRLRGWIHAGSTPWVALAGVILVIVAPTTRSRVGMIAFGLTALLLFGTSAVYHRGVWSEQTARVLRRLDHANIFLVIAGSYTAFATSLLSPEQARTLIVIMWVGAIAGVVFKLFWINAPRWVSTPLYVLLGWVAVFYLEPLYQAGGPIVLGLIALGGLLYTAGAVVFAMRRPNPWPGWFGFHEVFHACTVLAFTAHVAAAWLAMRAIPGG